MMAAADIPEGRRRSLGRIAKTQGGCPNYGAADRLSFVAARIAGMR